jgi:hypothetical protein
MQWLRHNVVGLIGLLIIVGGSFGTLYVKTEVNGGAVEQLKETVSTLNSSGVLQAITIQSNVIRVSSLETQLTIFTKSNDRLVEALDKLDSLYGSLVVSDAIQNEKLSQL